MTRVFMGRLSDRARERDVEKFFKGYGRIKDIRLKTGYGFVEFESERDADDAIHDLHQKELVGMRVVLELAKAGKGRNSPRPFQNNRRGGGNMAPVRTEHRLLVENLPTKVSWQDLKDLMRKYGDVTFADAHKRRPNEGIVEFKSRSDMKAALKKFDGYEISGRRLKVYEDKKSFKRGKSASRSRSRSRRKSSRSSSRSSRSHSSSKSKSYSRSKSRSLNRKERSRSNKRNTRSSPPKRSRSQSCDWGKDKEKKLDDKSRSVSPETLRKGRSHSKSATPKKHSIEKSKSRSRSRSASSGSDRKVNNFNNGKYNDDNNINDKKSLKSRSRSVSKSSNKSSRSGKRDDDSNGKKSRDASMNSPRYKSRSPEDD